MHRPAAADPEPLTTVRRVLLFLVLIGIVALVVELLLLEHTESATQLIPFVVLGAGLVTALLQMLRPSRRGLRLFQAIMLVFIAVGVLGIVLHFRGNVEFERETDPSARGLALLWHSLRGGVPLLAPGAMAQIGLLGLVFAYRHPVLRTGAASIQPQET
jgi:hypothetical protein